MTTKTLTQKLKVNTTYNIKSRCEGKFDDVRTHQFTEANPSLTIDMEDYNGLVKSYNSDDLTVDFNGTILPWKFDYNSSLEDDKFTLVSNDLSRCIWTYSQALNGTLNGTPTISDDFVIKYCNSSNNFITPVLNYSSPFKLEMHISFSSYPNSWPFKSMVDKSLDTYFGYGSMIVAVGNGSSYHDMTMSPTLPFNGTLTLEWDGSTYKYTALTTDGVSYGPVTYSSSTAIPNSKMYIGYCNANYDLKKFKFTSTNSAYSYQAVIQSASSYEKFKGCFYNYTDDGSEQTFNCFTRNHDEGIYLTKDSSIENERLIGTITIPSHTALVGKTLTINPTPSDAEVDVIAKGFDIQGNSYSSFDTESEDVKAYVSKYGYVSKKYDVTLDSNKSIDVSLDATNSFIDVYNYEYQSDSSNNIVLSEYVGTEENVVVPTIQRS